MKMVSRITAIGLAGVAICYLGLSGYVWYHDNKRSKQADVQAVRKEVKCESLNPSLRT